MTIPRSTIDVVRTQSDLAALFRAAGCTLTPEGSRFKTHCPVHNDDTPSLSIDPEHQRFRCFGCDWRGDAIELVMKTRHLDFPDAVRYLAEEFGLDDLPGLEAASAEPALPRSLEITQRAQAYFQECLTSRADEARQARAYLEGRNVDEPLTQRYGLGLAPPRWDALTKALLRQGITEEEMQEAGLAAPRRSASETRGVYDVFRGRITFPYRDEAGRVVGFGGRIVPAFAQTDRRPPPTYINSSETSYFTKGGLLFGLYEARESLRAERTIVLVEGYVDVLALARIGIAAVSAAGTALTAAQAQLLARSGAERVLIAFDGDPSGRAAAARAAGEILAAGPTPYVTTLPDGTDPADLVATEPAERVRQTIGERTTSGIRYLCNHGGETAPPTPEGHAPLIASGIHLMSGGEAEKTIARARHLAGVLARVDDDLRRGVFTSEAARLLSLPLGALHTHIEQAVAARRAAEHDTSDHSANDGRANDGGAGRPA